LISALESLQRLRDGNARFTANVRGLGPLLTQERRAALANFQEPHAIILGCSDSRVPAEIIFDCGLGDLFVVRVAGNVVAPSLVGSIEFAVAAFGTRLVVVMGHTRCGAIGATLDAIAAGELRAAAR
jgi:carbonic anhydrase